MYLSFATRNVEIAALNDSKWNMYTIYCTVVVVVVIVPVSFVLNEQPTVQFLMSALGIIIVVTLCLVFLILPKILLLNAPDHVRDAALSMETAPPNRQSARGIPGFGAAYVMSGVSQQSSPNPSAPGGAVSPRVAPISPPSPPMTAASHAFIGTCICEIINGDLKPVSMPLLASMAMHQQHMLHLQKLLEASNNELQRLRVVASGHAHRGSDASYPSNPGSPSHSAHPAAAATPNRASASSVAGESVVATRVHVARERDRSSMAFPPLASPVGAAMMPLAAPLLRLHTNEQRTNPPI